MYPIRFWQGPNFDDAVEELPAGAMLHDEVHTPGILVDFIELHNVRVVQ